LPVALCSVLAAMSWVGLHAAGFFTFSRWLMLGPATVATVALLGFKEVRRDLAWALQSRRARPLRSMESPSGG